MSIVDRRRDVPLCSARMRKEGAYSPERPPCRSRPATHIARERPGERGIRRRRDTEVLAAWNQLSSSMFSGSSSIDFTLTRNRTASLPSTIR